jgi:ferredoxin
MATIITEECINCGACLPQCPNNAIYVGGESWELDGIVREPIAPDVYYIVPDKCTECVGFFEHEECAAVCPVDCCVTDPALPESEEILLERAQRLHPDLSFAEPVASRFRR